jgi:hypothetical protein
VKLRLLRSLALSTSLAIAGCTRNAPTAALSSTVTDSAGISIITLARPLADVALGLAGAANDSGRKLFELDSLDHPVAVAFRRDGSIAIVDRTEWKVLVVDSTGRSIDSLGRRGDGPGDLRVAGGIAALGDALIVLQSYPTNTLTRFVPGSAPLTTSPPIPGDWDGWMWEQRDIGLEFPIQSAPEIWSRRLRALDDTTFLAYVGPIDTDTSAAARGHLLRFGRDLKLIDTVASVDPPHRAQKALDDPNAAPGMFREVWGTHPLWGAGEGSIAIARSDSARVQVIDRDGGLLAEIRWSPASAPVTEVDRAALGDRIIQATIAASPEALKNYQRTSESDRKAMIDQFMATFHLAALRPEISGLFISGRCLWMAGFDVQDDAEGTAHKWLQLDLDHPTEPRIITIGRAGERVVAIDRGKAATIRIDDDGVRQVRVYRVPRCRAAS